MGERQQPTNSELLATHLARRRLEALGEAAGAIIGLPLPVALPDA
jgi:hypothetical protein